MCLEHMFSPIEGFCYRYYFVFSVGYGDQFRKQKEKKQPEYKPYTLKDYKKITKSSPRTGGLGPDMDNDILREKVKTQNIHAHLF